MYYESASGLTTSAAWSAESDQADAHFGNAVASAGDVNRDGYGDLIVGARAYNNGVLDEGAAFVYLGSASGLATSAAWSTEGGQDNAYLGYAVASAGDVNADGYGDVIVGARGYDNADEVCNEIDDNCDDVVDVDAIDAETWYADADGDGFTHPDETLAACEQPDGYAAATEDDCDDADATSSPGAEDLAGDGVDQDCDGADASEGAEDTGDTPKDGGGEDCGCASSRGVTASGWGLLLGALVAGRRGRRAA